MINNVLIIVHLKLINKILSVLIVHIIVWNVIHLVVLNVKLDLI